MKTSVIIIVGVLALLVLIFLIIRNQKDKKEVIDQIKNDYPKSKDEEGDVDVDNRSQPH
jgi:preprotein translocase subunit YajC